MKTTIYFKYGKEVFEGFSEHIPMVGDQVQIAEALQFGGRPTTFFGIVKSREFGFDRSGRMTHVSIVVDI